jgi:hypothetical protein
MPRRRPHPDRRAKLKSLHQGKGWPFLLMLGLITDEWGF